jgi:hypothetical protein
MKSREMEVESHFNSFVLLFDYLLFCKNHAVLEVKKCLLCNTPQQARM